MDIIQLRYVRELAAKAGFSAAAHSLGVTQPAISSRIKQLEQELGFALFDRLKNPLALTPQGEQFLEQATEILQRFENLERLGDVLQEEIAGVLTVGIIPTLAPYFVPLFINELNAKYPALTLVIEELVTEEIISRLKNGGIDAGILSTPVNTRGIRFSPLFYERFYLYVSDRHPLYNKKEIDLSDFDAGDLWYLQEGNCFQNQVNAICKLANKTLPGEQLRYRSNSIESLRRIVEHRKGMTFIPELATLLVPPDQEDMIIPVKGEAPVREISIAVSKAFSRHNLLNAFVDEVLQHLPAYMKKKPDSWVVETGLEM